MTWLVALDALLGFSPIPESACPEVAPLHIAHSADTALGQVDQVALEAPAAIVPSLAPLHPGMSPQDHFAQLGGHEAIALHYGDMPLAFRLWDSARLWTRDRDTERRARWEAQYRLAFERLEKLDLAHRLKGPIHESP